jgi:hypothetical protein
MNIMTNQPSTTATNAPNEDKGVPIMFTPASLRMFEERLVVAAKCGYEVITFDGVCITLAYGQATAAAVRQRFYASYSQGFIDWVVGPAPDFSRNADLAALEKLIPQESLAFIR